MPEPLAPPIPTAPFLTVGKTAYPTALAKKRERPGSAALKAAIVSRACLISLVVSAPTTPPRRPSTSTARTPLIFDTMRVSFPSQFASANVLRETSPWVAIAAALHGRHASILPQK